VRGGEDTLVHKVVLNGVEQHHSTEAMLPQKNSLKLKKSSDAVTTIMYVLHPRSVGEQSSSRSKDYCIVGEGGRSLKRIILPTYCKKSAISIANTSRSSYLPHINSRPNPPLGDSNVLMLCQLDGELAAKDDSITLRDCIGPFTSNFGRNEGNQTTRRV